MKVGSAVLLSRRAVLRGSALATGGLILGIGLPAEAKEGRVSDGATKSGAKLNAFIRILPDESVTMIMPAVEMGQGAYTSMAMILAEELDIGIEAVTLEHAPPDQKNYANPALGAQITGGSTTMFAWYLPLRKTGARARQMLLAAAGEAWGVDIATLRTAGGKVLHDASGRTATYGALERRAASIVPP
ncbi:MAG: molybdopterin-dependent oxidoreductase, partial [Rhizobiaceae bacterium]|nr:molybdopterin-dependent oxidoreductase [Rhizobiaceae bacterium]